MRTKQSLITNTVVGGGAKVSSVLLRLVQIPILISVLGAEEYGRWLILSSFPTWLALANLGFGSVAANEIAMAVGANDLIKARRVLSTTLALTIVIGIIGISIFSLTAFYIKWYILIQVSSIRQNELAYAMIWLVLSLFLSFSGEAFGGRFRAVRRTHEAMILNSLRPWFDLLAMYIALQYSMRLDFLSVSLLISTIIYLLIFRWFSSRAAPHINFSIDNIQPKQFRQLFQKGIAFQAMPLGNAILYQGNLMIVQITLGPLAVALFGTIRMLTRSVSQALDLINTVTWPELSLLLGEGNLPKAARLHRLAVGTAFILAICGAFFLFIFGSSLYEWWVGKLIKLPPHLFILFLLPIPFYSLWFTSCVVHLACNKHEGLAINYLIACSISAAACYVLSITNGIEGAALSTLFADILLIPYVLKRSLELTGDNWRGFLSGFTYELFHLNQLVKLKRAKI